MSEDDLEKAQEIVAGGIEAAGLDEAVLPGGEPAARRPASTVGDEAADRMIALITAATGQAGPGDAQVAAQIAGELGFLPLALEQAAAYITQARVPLARYLELLRQHPARVHVASLAGDRAQNTIARLWDITLEAIGRADPAAAGLMGVLACYAPDAIPRRVIGGPEPGPGVDEALGLLASSSMITLTAEAVSMHELVQAVILASPGDADSPPPRDTALEWLGGVLPPDPDQDVAAWPFLRALIPHAEAVAGRYPAGGEPAALARVHGQIALFHYSQGAYQDALRLQRASLDIAERIHGDDHRETAACLGNLAATYSALGRHKEALPLQKRALAVTEAALGPDHPDTAVRLNDLAAIYRAVGRKADAAAMKRRARRDRHK